ncbi:MAG: NAD(P)/FAD-dependent oxidoreductase [Solirubrobacteraceae bacterium]
MGDHVVVLGAGFGGLELSTMLSEELGEDAGVTLIDKGDAFVFGFSKLDVMFGRSALADVRMPYSHFAKAGVKLVQETVLEVDPVTRTVRTDRGVHEADELVIALGADYDIAATPGLAEVRRGGEFYSVAGAERLAPQLQAFKGGHALVAVAHAPFKCPPAPSECALMLDDLLTAGGRRSSCAITFAMALPSPVPPSPEMSEALREEFAGRGIEFLPSKRLASVDDSAGVAHFKDGSEIAYDLLLAVPRHRAPALLEGMLDDEGYVPVDPATLQTAWDGVYAIGDVATAGVPKAGVFAEGAAKVVARSIVARRRGEPQPGRHLGQGTCYIEFGADRIASVEIDFLSGPDKTGRFNPPSAEQRALKDRFGSDRRGRWFGL